jgi:hypothetical protein
VEISFLFFGRIREQHRMRRKDFSTGLCSCKVYTRVVGE